MDVCLGVVDVPCPEQDSKSSRSRSYMASAPLMLSFYVKIKKS